MRPLILRRRLASLLPPRLSVKLAAALGALVLVMTSVTSFVSYHYCAHPDPGKPEKRRSGAPAKRPAAGKLRAGTDDHHAESSG